MNHIFILRVVFPFATLAGLGVFSLSDPHPASHWSSATHAQATFLENSSEGKDSERRAHIGLTASMNSDGAQNGLTASINNDGAQNSLTASMNNDGAQNGLTASMNNDGAQNGLTASMNNDGAQNGLTASMNNDGAQNGLTASINNDGAVLNTSAESLNTSLLSTTASYTHGDELSSSAYVISVSEMETLLQSTNRSTYEPDLTRSSYLMRVVYTSPSSGFIQLPGLEDSPERAAGSEESVVALIPALHVLMASASRACLLGKVGPGMCFSDSATLTGTAFTTPSHPLSHAPRTTRELTWLLDGKRQYPVALFPPGAVSVRYVSKACRRRYQPGFTISFTYHRRSSAPQRLSDGKWNCTVAHWPDFRPHVACDLERHCAAGEDEAACPYTSPRCGPGLLAAGASCLQLTPLYGATSWTQAAELCRQRGMRLAALNSREEWRGVWRALQAMPCRIRFLQLFIGLTSSHRGMPTLYSSMWQWTDTTVAYYSNGFHLKRADSLTCYVLNIDSVLSAARGVNECPCRQPQTYTSGYLCEAERNPERPTPPVLSSNGSMQRLEGTLYSCDVVTPPPFLFTCSSGVERVAFSVLCDHHWDCGDHSDEHLCVFPACHLGQFHCDNKQDWLCDGRYDCATALDEEGCRSGVIRKVYVAFTPPAGIVTFHKDYGAFQVTAAPVGGPGFACPPTHFECRSARLCLPVYTRCNRVADCPGLEDEAACQTYACPGFYRCRASVICVHASQLCDGVRQCPLSDDERYCSTGCPRGCSCCGAAFTCRSPPRVNRSHRYVVRQLDVRGSGRTMADGARFPFITSYSIADSNITRLDEVFLPNLFFLDISNNSVFSFPINLIRMLPNLRVLIAKNNPMVITFSQHVSDHKSQLQVLDLSDTSSPSLDTSLFVSFPKLQVLNVSSSDIAHIYGTGFGANPELRVVDLRKCSINRFPPGLLRGLLSLRAVYVDNTMLCCPLLLPPGFSPLHCRSSGPALLPCRDLLPSATFRVAVLVVALTGSVGSSLLLCHHARQALTGTRPVFSALMTHGQAGDALSGVYWLVVVAADHSYRGRYAWSDRAWRTSAGCRVAGVCLVLGHVLSTCVLTLTALYGVSLSCATSPAPGRFGKLTANVVCLLVWCCALTYSTLPLAPPFSHWEFYTQSALCVPALTAEDSASGLYVAVGRVAALFLSAFGSAGLVFTLRYARETRARFDNSQKANMECFSDTKYISMLHCVCNLIIPATLALTWEAKDSESVAVLTVLTTLKSSLSPGLYVTCRTLRKKRAERRAKLIQLMTGRLKTVGRKASVAGRRRQYTGPEAWDLVQLWIDEGTLSVPKIVNIMERNK